MEREFRLKKSDSKGVSSKDPNYHAMMLKLFSLEEQDKKHSEEIKQREQELLEKLKEQEKNQNDAAVEELANLEQVKEKIIKEFDDEKTVLISQIETAQQEYSEALARSLKNKSSHSKAQNVFKEAQNKLNNHKQIEQRVDKKVYFLAIITN